MIFDKQVGEENMSPFHRWPIWVRISAALLVVSLVAGQIWQRQPAGDGTRLVLSLVKQHCPAAVRPTAAPSVGDGARAIDRYAEHRLAAAVDRMRGLAPRDRCSVAGSVRPAPTPGSAS